MKTICENRRARFDYEIQESLEAGIELKGHEVKSIKNGRVTITGSYAAIHNEELWLINADIPPYQPQNTPVSYNPKRSRRLLIKTQELKNLIGKIKTEHLTIIPLKLYNKHGLIKAELGIARHKKKFDKREIIKKREVKRELDQIFKRE